MKDLAPRRRTRGEGFLGLQSFESFRRVRGVAWFERGDRLVFPLTRNPTSLGCWRLRFKSGRTHLTSGSKPIRSEEHTSELQSRLHLVCRLLLEKKKQIARQDRSTRV